MLVLITTFFAYCCDGPHEASQAHLYLNTVGRIYEKLQGQGFLSQGAQDVMEQFEGIDLSGKQLLDVGCGLGGVDFALAAAFNVNITAVDIASDVLAIARERYRECQKDLKGNITFIQIEPTQYLSLFVDGMFDFAWSREVFLHLPSSEKLCYFQHIYRVLKSEGIVRIVDWCHATEKYSQDFQAMIEIDETPYHLPTIDVYKELLTKSGLQVEDYKDLSDAYKDYCVLDKKRLFDIKHEVIQEFGPKAYDDMVESMKLQNELFQAGELRAGQFTAKKP